MAFRSQYLDALEERDKKAKGKKYRGRKPKRECGMTDKLKQEIRDDAGETFSNMLDTKAEVKAYMNSLEVVLARTDINEKDVGYWINETCKAIVTYQEDWDAVDADIYAQSGTEGGEIINANNS